MSIDFKCTLIFADSCPAFAFLFRLLLAGKKPSVPSSSWSPSCSSLSLSSQGVGISFPEQSVLQAFSNFGSSSLRPGSPGLPGAPGSPRRNGAQVFLPLILHSLPVNLWQTMSLPVPDSSAKTGFPGAGLVRNDRVAFVSDDQSVKFLYGIDSCGIEVRFENQVYYRRTANHIIRIDRPENDQPEQEPTYNNLPQAATTMHADGTANDPLVGTYKPCDMLDVMLDDDVGTKSKLPIPQGGFGYPTVMVPGAPELLIEKKSSPSYCAFYLPRSLGNIAKNKSADALYEWLKTSGYVQALRKDLKENMGNHLTDYHIYFQKMINRVPKNFQIGVSNFKGRWGKVHTYVQTSPANMEVARQLLIDALTGTAGAMLDRHTRMGIGEVRSCAIKTRCHESTSEPLD